MIKGIKGLGLRFGFVSIGWGVRFGVGIGFKGGGGEGGGNAGNGDRCGGE